MLLHHAIKFEYGGWRVWVDTLAIVHSKVVIFSIIIVIIIRRPHCHHHHHYHSHQHQHHHYHHIGTNYLTATVKLISSLNNCTNQVSFEEFKLQFSAMYEQVISFLKLTLELRKIISRLSVREEKS